MPVPFDELINGETYVWPDYPTFKYPASYSPTARSRPSENRNQGELFRVSGPDRMVNMPDPDRPGNNLEFKTAEFIKDDPAPLRRPLMFSRLSFPPNILYYKEGEKERGQTRDVTGLKQAKLPLPEPINEQIGTMLTGETGTLPIQQSKIAVKGKLSGVPDFSKGGKTRKRKHRRAHKSRKTVSKRK